MESNINTSNELTTQRPVTPLLVLGILLMPYIFAWYTLGEGRSTKSKVLSFLWLAFMLLGSTAGPHTTSEPTTTTKPYIAEKSKPVIKAPDFDLLADMVIKKGLMSPSSYNRKSSSLEWTGTDEFGRDAAVVKLKYDAANSYGAILTGCKFVSFWVDNDGSLGWYDNSVYEDCDGVTMDGYQIPPMPVESLVQVNFYRQANQ